MVDNMKLIILKEDRYNKVKDGSMTVWLTLNDDFAKSIQIDEILRIMNDNTSDVCYVRVNGFYVYSTFDELYKKVDKTALGYDEKNKGNIARIKKEMFCNCSPELEKQHGVRGIKFEYMPSYKPLDEMTEKELEKHYTATAKKLHNLIIKTDKNMSNTIDNIDDLQEILDHDPMIFAISQHPENRTMFKEKIAEITKQSQSLLDKINDIENRHKQLEQEYDEQNPPII